jgi:hypothetical protein
MWGGKRTGDSYANVYRYIISDDFLNSVVEIANNISNKKITSWFTIVVRNVGGKISINGGDTIIEDVKTPSTLTYAR